MQIMLPQLLRFVSWGLVLGLASSGCLVAADSNRQLAADCVQSYLQDHPRAAVTVGIVSADGAQVYGFGQLKRDISDSRPDGKTIYQIGSITKVFTTTMLAEQIFLGHMNLDDPAQKYLPADLLLPKEKDREITLKDLATHHSGLPRLPQLASYFMLGGAIAQNPYAGNSWQDMPLIMRTVWLSTPIGSQYGYSNLAMGLLGQALVHTTRSVNYAELVAERISKPLGLTDTCVELNDVQSSRLVQGYNSLGQMAPAWDFASLEGAGALYSTVDDLLVFAAANLGLRDSTLRPAMELAQRPVAERRWPGGPLGLGWHIKTAEDPARPSGVWHNGMTGGYASMLVLVPEKKFAVVVLSNVAASVDEPAMKIAAMVIKQQDQGAVKDETRN